jgi:hypothetical protein
MMRSGWSVSHRRCCLSRFCNLPCGVDRPVKWLAIRKGNEIVHYWCVCLSVCVRGREMEGGGGGKERER